MRWTRHGLLPQVQWEGGSMSEEKIIVRPIAWSVITEGKPLFDEFAVTVQIVDEGSGEFLELEALDGKLKIGPEDWPNLRNTIETAFQQIEKHEKKGDVQ